MSEVTEFEGSNPNRYPVDHEIISLDDGTFRLILGEDALQVVNPARDLAPEFQADISSDFDCLLIDSETFNPGTGEGFKALEDGEEIILGSENGYHSFTFDPTVSENHVRIKRTGSEIVIEDLHSTNGTFVETFPELKDWDTKTEKEFPSLIGAVSVASEYHRDRNDDAYFISEADRALGVFDGVSEFKGSGEASRIAAAMIEGALGAIPGNANVWIARLGIHMAFKDTHAVINAKRAVLTESEEKDGYIATTATAAKMFEPSAGSPYFVVANAGDSRAYLMREEKIKALTLDDVYRARRDVTEQELMQARLSQAVDEESMSAAERVAFKSREIINSYLGGDLSEPNITLSVFNLLPKDRILLTTDAIPDNLITDEVEDTMRSIPDNQEAAEHLVHQAKVRSRDLGHLRAKPDDMTAVVMTYAA